MLGTYEQRWELVALDAEQVLAGQEAKSVADAAAVTQKIDALWNAADKYVAGYISGIAIGLLTLGVVQGKPKALAVTAWSSAVWDAYYTRKATVTATSADDLDFSTFGPMPHTVPELRERSSGCDHRAKAEADPALATVRNCRCDCVALDVLCHLRWKRKSETNRRGF